MDGLVDYQPLLVREDADAAAASRYGTFRAARLRKLQPTSATAWGIDALWAVAFPASFGVATATLAVALLQIEAIDDWVKSNPISPQVISALSTLVAFIVSLRLGQNLTQNAASITSFGDLCGACVNIAVWARSLVSSSNFEYVTLPDGKGGFYQTSTLGLILASIPFVIKYTFRRTTEIRFEELPVAGDPALLARAKELTTSTDGFAAVSAFTALLMLIGEYVDDLETNGEIKPNELGTLFAQVNALTAAEGVIAGSNTYSNPAILGILLYGVFFSWLFLLSLTDIAPESGFNALWLVGLLALTSVGVYALSNRYANPFALRSRNSTQAPIIAVACKETEVAIDGVFARRGRLAPMKANTVPSGAWLDLSAARRRA